MQKKKKASICFPIISAQVPRMALIRTAGVTCPFLNQLPFPRLFQITWIRNEGVVSLLQNWRNSTNGRREGCWASRPQMFITTSQGNLPGKCKLRNWEVLVFYTCHPLATIRLLEIAEVLKTLRIQVCHDLPSTLGDPIPTLPCFESGITPLLSGKMRAIL